MHLQDDECNEKVEDFAPDDMLEDPDDPLRSRDVSQTIYPDVDHTEGVVEHPERSTVLWRTQAAEQDKINTPWLRFGLETGFVLYCFLFFLYSNTFFHHCVDYATSSGLCPCTSRQCRPLWTGHPQRKGRRGGRWGWSASEPLCLSAAEAGSSGSGWPDGRGKAHTCTCKERCTVLPPQEILASHQSFEKHCFKDHSTCSWNIQLHRATLVQVTHCTW